MPAHSIDKKFPVAEEACKEIISLPIWPGMSQDQQKYVVDTVKEFLNKNISYSLQINKKILVIIQI